MSTMLTRSRSATPSRRILHPTLGLSTCLGLAFALSAACSAGGGAGPGEGEKEKVPSTTDTNGDGVADELGVTLDLDDDGEPDLFDIDMDGTPDGIGVDTDNDGVLDAVGYDTNGDGIIDALDTDGDGIPDRFATDDAPAGDGDGDGDIDIGDGDSPNQTGKYCQTQTVDFVPQTPTVYILVDRSSSMFEATMFWANLKAGVLPVVEQLQGDVRFGFGSYTGSNATCTGLSEGAPIGENNYDAIATAYNALAAPSEKGETPTALAVQQATDILLADESPGERFILLVTDGDPDFCNDPAPQCGADALVASLQTAAGQGVRTLVFGIENAGIQNPAWFDYYAQAGMGQLPSWADGLNVSAYSGKLQSECSGQAPWISFREENGNAADPAMCGGNQPPEGNPACYLPAGDYSAEGGSATAFLNADPEALAAQILSSVDGLKSCIFDLSDGGVSVKTELKGQGDVFVDDMDTPIPQDQWQLNDEITLELLGDACTKWQSPEVTEFFAGFPCEAIVVR